jgi:cytochrome bd-type quinol oxidase subunit 2
MAEEYRRYRSAPRIAPLKLALAAVAVVVLWGGYQAHWSWTGIDSETATLWDWLTLLLLPITVAALPVWLRRRRRLGRRGKLAIAGGLLLFGALVAAGYAVPMSWTGFGDNKLWDWLNLLVLPLTVATFPVWGELRRDLRIHHRLAIAAALAFFAVAVLGGYLGGWGWTGFRGNTLWDWLHLLLLPIALPTLLLPAALATLGADEPDEPDEPHDQAAGKQPRLRPAGVLREPQAQPPSR